MENTQEIHETLKPEQMESGKWYVVDYFLIKFEKIEDERIYRYKSFDLECKLNFTNIRDGFLIIKNNNKIRPATKEEVLKYFPDEVFEPIELRPEDLVSGEVYTATDGTIKRTFIFTYFTNYVHYKKMIDYNGIFKKNGCLSRGFKFYHATPEEKALLLGGEEPTDWKSMYNKLQEVHQDLERQYRELKDSYTNSYNELKAKYDQLEKGEKVYFYFDYLDNLIKTTDFEFALHESSEDSPIYKGVFMGKKKSVLVNE